MNAYMTDEAIEEMEETWRLRREAVRLLGLIVAEWQSDPQSVQCFDLRIVEAATKTVKRLEQLKHVDVV